MEILLHRAPRRGLTWGRKHLGIHKEGVQKDRDTGRQKGRRTDRDTVSLKTRVRTQGGIYRVSKAKGMDRRAGKMKDNEDQRSWSQDSAMSGEPKVEPTSQQSLLPGKLLDLQFLQPRSSPLP